MSKKASIQRIFGQVNFQSHSMFQGRIILTAAQETTEIRIFNLKQVDFQRSPEVAVSFLLKILRHSRNEMGHFQA